MQGMLRGARGGLELSKLTVFWNIIDSLKRQNPVRRVRKPRLGRVVPQRPLWVTSRRKAAPISMSALRGKADVNHWAVECLLIAISGHLATRVRSRKFSKNGLYGPPPMNPRSWA